MDARERGVFVYFLQSLNGGPIKIGKSYNDPEQRFRELQCGSAVSFLCLGLTYGPESLERKLHQRFRDAHIRGEWFRPVPELIEYIRGLDPEHQARRGAAETEMNPGEAAPASGAAQLENWPDILSVQEVAKLLGISYGLAYEQVRQGRIPSFRIGRRHLVPKMGLLRMLEKAAPP